MPETSETIDYRRVWRRHGERVMQDAVAMWKSAGVLPGGVSPEARAEELVIAIYDGETMAGCLTADIHVLPRLREKFAFCRSFISPAWRGRRLTDRLMIDGHDELGHWSKAHPEEGLAGCAAIYQNRVLGRSPVEPSGLSLIGYTPQGEQLRVLWFDHHRLRASEA
ncbi:MAG: hypothetical protein CVT83_05440 [Alphaproteobacteria bacterium HGW-Alphaproteobacteria-5]|nr:MAG: hypothetical protein CVT83_05440 [Alphaproteobacteria bacterium HGW-Alphaproteobacteria-5]